MAAKVALTAEEFRENSQRSIALFNTEKLSTDSTHVLKSAYCNSVHFCRCNLHGACGGKERINIIAYRFRIVAICTGRVEAKFIVLLLSSPKMVAICTGRVEAKVVLDCYLCDIGAVAICTGRVEAKRTITRSKRQCLTLQSARGVWRQSMRSIEDESGDAGCNLHGACGGKVSGEDIHFVNLLVAICTGRVEDLASSPEKNPRKFMQTYCIFIHLGV